MKVYHILNASIPHLTIKFSQSFIEDLNSDELSNYVIIFGKTDEKNSAVYSKLEQKFHGQLQYIENYKEIIRIIRNNRNSSILIHGDNLKLIAIAALISSKINWVCWGANTKTNSTFLSKATYFLKKYIFNKLNSIITLLEGDKICIENSYECKNVIVMPYYHRNTGQNDSLSLFNIPYSNPPKVLVGNSGHNYENYKEILKPLSVYAPNIEVHCMFQYPEDPEKRQMLESYGKELFGENFHLDTKLLESSEYHQYLSSYDIYICHALDQTGLAALYNSLYFGKKAYVNGVNLSWTKSLGYYVFDSKSIENLSYDEFINELSYDKKIANRKTFAQFREGKLIQWKKYLGSIANDYNND